MKFVCTTVTVIRKAVYNLCLIVTITITFAITVAVTITITITNMIVIEKGVIVVACAIANLIAKACSDSDCDI